MLLAAAALLALGLIACGGSDGGGEGQGVDVDALESCLDEDPASTLARDESGLEDIEVQPTDGWELMPTDPDALSVPSFVMVFPDEESADAAVADLRDNDIVVLGEEGTVRWVIIETDDGYSDDLNALISDCVAEAS
jgi:hypothetical protein